MKKNFNISRESERKIFRAYVEMIKPFLKGLRPRECDVLSEILYQCHLRRNIKSVEDRFALVLGTSGRHAIAEALETDQSVLRNAIMSLKRKNIIKADNTIHSVYLLDLKDNEPVEVSFTFSIKP